MTASNAAKNAGLNSLKEMSEMTGRPRSTLMNWHEAEPVLFNIVLQGCLVIKNKPVEKPLPLGIKLNRGG